MTWYVKNLVVSVPISIAIAGILCFAVLSLEPTSPERPLVVRGFLVLAGLVVVGFGLRVANSEFSLLSYWHHEERRDLRYRIYLLLRATGFAVTVLITMGLVVIIAALLLPRPSTPAPPEKREVVKPVIVRCDEVARETTLLLQVAMQTRIDTKYYVIQPYVGLEPFPESEADSSYYLLDIKDAHADRRLYFDPGQYTISAFSQSFNESIDAFAANILRPIAPVSDYRIFVRGSADLSGDRTFSGYFVRGYEYREVAYYPSFGSSSSQFLMKETQRSISEPFSNEDLHFLRGAFVQDVLSSFPAFVANKPTVLQGEVTRNYSRGDMNVQMILMVDWIR